MYFNIIEFYKLYGNQFKSNVLKLTNDKRISFKINIALYNLSCLRKRNVLYLKHSFRYHLT